MTPTPNEGDRPSRLALDRFATAELTGAARDAMAAAVEDDRAAQAHLDALEAARAQVAPFDAAALRARARQVATTADPLPEPANRPMWLWLAPLVVLAAAVLLGLLPMLRPEPTLPPDYTGLRGNDTLQLYHLQDRLLHKYEGSALREGDVLGFKVQTHDRDGVVILSVDGEGRISVFYPSEGDAPEPLTADGLVALPDSIILDDAPGPEVFFAVFDQPVSAAREDAAHAWQSGGFLGLRDWAEGSADVDFVVVDRR